MISGGVGTALGRGCLIDRNPNDDLRRVTAEPFQRIDNLAYILELTVRSVHWTTSIEGNHPTSGRLTVGDAAIGTSATLITTIHWHSVVIS